VASWLDWPRNRDDDEPTPDEWASHWSKCISEAAADILLFVALKHETQCGALLEVGAALSAGRSVYLISPHQWSFEHHPNVCRFATLEEAITAIMAMQAGEAALMWHRSMTLTASAAT
jgi:hypothetical protein